METSLAANADQRISTARWVRNTRAATNTASPIPISRCSIRASIADRTQQVCRSTSRHRRSQPAAGTSRSRKPDISPETFILNRHGAREGTNGHDRSHSIDLPAPTVEASGGGYVVSQRMEPHDPTGNDDIDFAEEIDNDTASADDAGSEDDTAYATAGDNCVTVFGAEPFLQSKHGFGDGTGGETTGRGRFSRPTPSS